MEHSSNLEKEIAIRGFKVTHRNFSFSERDTGTPAKKFLNLL